MSVLFKALQRAEKVRSGDAAEASTDIGVAAAADPLPRGMPGLGRRPKRRAGTGRLVVRGLGLSFLAAMAVSVGTMVVFPDAVEEAFTALIADAPAPRPRPLPAALPTPAGTAAPQDETETETETGAVAEAEADPAPDVAGEEEMVIEAVIVDAAPSPPPDAAPEAGSLAVPNAPAAPPGSEDAAGVPVPAGPSDPAADGSTTTDIATLMAAARAVQAQQAPTPTPAVPTPAAGIGERGGPVRLTGLSVDGSAGGTADGTAEGTPVAETVAVPPDPRSVEDVLADRARAQQARVVAPPVVVDRPEARRAGAGDAVSVALPTLYTRDTVAGAYRALLRGDFHSALASYEAVLEEDPRSLQALLGRAAALHKLRRLDEARRAYEQVLAADPANREALTNLLALIAAAAPQEALARLHALERTAPDFTPVLAQIALVYGQMGADAQAIGYLQKAVAQDPANVAYRYNLAVLLDRAGQRPAAAQAYQAVLDGLRARGTGAGASSGTGTGTGEGDVAGLSADRIKARLDYLIAAR